MKRVLCALVALASVAGLVVAQCPAGTTTLNTNIVSNNGQSGVMFDVVSSVNLTICTFNVNFDPGTWNISIYRLPPIPDAGVSYYQPNHNNATPWGAPIANLTVTSAGLNVPTPLPLALNQVMNANQRMAFYISATVGTAQNYVNGTAHNTIWATDGNLTVLTGAGKALPLFSATIFGGTATASRNFSGSVCYVLGSGGCPTGPWETNDANSSFDFNGVVTAGFQPAITTVCLGGPVSANFGSALVGNGYDVAVSFVPIVPLGGGGISTPNNQKVNVDLTDPNLFFLNGLTLPPFPGNFSLPYAAVPISPISAQMVILDPSNADLLSLSQAGQQNSTAGTPFAPGPVGDDLALQINLTTPNFCGEAVEFYGTTYTQAQFVSNGRIMFGTPDVDFSPTVAEALADSPFLGWWMDLNPGVGGSIDVAYGDNLLPAAVQAFLYPGPFGVRTLCFRWFDVPIFGTTILVRYYVYYVYYHFPGGPAFRRWILRCELAAAPGASTQNQFVGLSRGIGFATDPGAQNFTPPGTGPAVPNPTDMLYSFGNADGAHLGGANTIEFTPAPGGGYTWASYFIP